MGREENEAVVKDTSNGEQGKGDLGKVKIETFILDDTGLAWAAK
jgi:hypothetical protein